MSGQRIWHETEVVAALGEGATLVTASERLGRAAQLAYADAQRRAGAEVWERPRILSWQGLLSELAGACQDAALAGRTSRTLPRVLSEFQAEALWEKVVRASGAGDGLLQPAAAAQAAQEAWSLCHEYRLDPAQLARSGMVDAEQFGEWASAFQMRCDNEGWLDPARLPDQLMRWIAASHIAIPECLLFAGFDEWTPQQQYMLQALRDTGTRVVQFTLDAAAAGAAQRVMCDDAEHELRMAARWAGALLERDPDTRIGIVVRDLSACRERFARILDQTLCPSACVGEAPPRPYNLSLGRPLAAWPLIHDALAFLRLAHGWLDFNAVSHLLHSPFLRAAEFEQAARARFESSLREGGEQFSLTRFAGLARERGNVPELATVLDGWLEWKKDQTRRQLPSYWARSFAVLLGILGWPGERTRDSIEQQTLEAFRDTLGELARLDSVLGAVEMDDATRRLARLVARRTFQPAADDVPVQVLGVLEAAGLHFDHLWITGLSDDVWPASPRPNPLLPVGLQRLHDMPHASARRELDFAQRISARLLASAPDVMVSVAQHDADQELQPSPLIAALPAIDSTRIAQYGIPGYAQFLHAAAPVLETLEDAQGPALRATEASGGTGILKSQAACPFQAFARYRLGAKPMIVPGPGLDPAERGSLLHDVMNRVWGELGNHATLVAQNDAAIRTLISAHTAAALAAASSKQPGVFTPRFLELEQQRLTRLVSDWLQVERTRQAFNVEQREYQQAVRIGPLAFTTRVDRVDQLADGTRAIIDYKTGDAKPSAWSSERPDEPQLPCYAVTAAEPVSALLFGILRPGETEYRGYVRSEAVLPDIGAFDTMAKHPDGCEDWDALLTHWRNVLTRLAEDFAGGKARVDPKDRNRTCGVCHLAALCRVDESQQAGDIDDE
ncbi:MAG TPA: PD-(D/E)XK nuclease family protein [Gammaproteobacteria bacterium]|nr:PD-(D/E)XK nuclease family protein [Gammaproteobacteria bacterium]